MNPGVAQIGAAASGDPGTLRRRADRVRLAVVAGLQAPAVALLVWGTPPGAAWCAGLWGSAVCCAGMDSHWRWRNRLLMAAAVGWLAQALLR